MIEQLINKLKQETSSQKAQYISIVMKWAKEEVTRNIYRKNRYIEYGSKLIEIIGKSDYYKEHKFYHDSASWVFNEDCLGRFDICNTQELKDIYDVDYFFTPIHKYFNSDCENIRAPLWTQVFDWLRTEHNIHIIIEPETYYDIPYVTWAYIIYKLDVGGDREVITIHCDQAFNTSYECTREKAILKAIDIIEEQNKK